MHILQVLQWPKKKYNLFHEEDASIANFVKIQWQRFEPYKNIVILLNYLFFLLVNEDTALRKHGQELLSMAETRGNDQMDKQIFQIKNQALL